MAIVDRKSTFITNATATPRVLTNSAVSEGRLRSCGGTITPATDDSATSVFRFCRVPSNARVRGVYVTAADFTTAGAVNIGLHATQDDGTGAVVDADLFASALDLSGGPFTHLDVTFESGEYTVAEADQLLWQVLGLSADPQKWYDVTATISTNFNGGQAIRIDVDYVV